LFALPDVVPDDLSDISEPEPIDRLRMGSLIVCSTVLAIAFLALLIADQASATTF
jgi:hypothetical protein